MAAAFQKLFVKSDLGSWVRWHTPLTPASRWQRQAGPCESEDSLVYGVSFGPARDTEKHPFSKQKAMTTKYNLGTGGAVQCRAPA